eukprot:TRINITY_DN5539_c0_g2_i1.p1 TRINITY_DN5539_c0_g2~~TRINITY_DN5539_c0_g2_i1.p1  ORF type:complete len:443 (+),score=117.58 TRINITY_DN5539_c0_g2_i1:37-1365(+)
MANPWELRAMMLFVSCVVIFNSQQVSQPREKPQISQEISQAVQSQMKLQLQQLSSSLPQQKEKEKEKSKKQTDVMNTFRTIADMSSLPSQESEITMRVAKSWTKPSFYTAFTDPKLDTDVSAQLSERRVVELGITRVWQNLLGECCQRDPKRPGLVVDVGGNFGWYSLLAAAHGCRVVAWEPVPLFRTYFETAIGMNGFEHLIELRSKIVSNSSGGVGYMSVPTRGIWGMAGVAGTGGRPKAAEGKAIPVDIEKVDDVVSPNENVCVMKVDVEGFEPQVFQGAANLLKGGNVENVVFEYSPGYFERAAADADALKKFPAYVQSLIDYGFDMYHLQRNLFNAPTSSIKDAGFWEKPFPGYIDFITKDNLKNDFDDVERRRTFDSTGGKKFKAHPQSMRASFGFNTNVWGSYKGRSFERTGIQKGRAVCDGATYPRPRNPGVFD